MKRLNIFLYFNRPAPGKPDTIRYRPSTARGGESLAQAGHPSPAHRQRGCGRGVLLRAARFSARVPGPGERDEARPLLYGGLARWRAPPPVLACGRRRRRRRGLFHERRLTLRIAMALPADGSSSGGGSTTIDRDWRGWRLRGQ